MVRARLATSSPSPPKASGAEQAYHRRARRRPRSAGCRTRARRTRRSRPPRGPGRRAARPTARRGSRCARIGVAMSRLSSFRTRAMHDREADAPHAAAHDVHADQAGQHPVDVARAQAAPPCPRARRTRRAAPSRRCSAWSAARRASRVSGRVGSYRYVGRLPRDHDEVHGRRSGASARRPRGRPREPTPAAAPESVANQRRRRLPRPARRSGSAVAPECETRCPGRSVSSDREREDPEDAPRARARTRAAASCVSSTSGRERWSHASRRCLPVSDDEHVLERRVVRRQRRQVHRGRPKRGRAALARLRGLARS